MNIGILKEKTSHEMRVSIIPTHIPQLIKRGFHVYIEKDAGSLAGYPDEAYIEKGAHMMDNPIELIKKANLICCVKAAQAADDGIEMINHMSETHILIGLLEPYSPHESFDLLLSKKITSFSLELIPRTTRAQSMDVLSSMANLAGYKSVLIAANESKKMFPMMMTAAGTIIPSKVFVLGVGVAGLQAIATAKRLGAVVSAYDVRSAVKEQVLSLGAKFIEFDLESAEGAGGYAKQMDEAYYKKQQSMMQDIIKTMDVVITTANIPGKKAPILVTKEMVHAMSKGSVIIDLAAERGGNCAYTQLGKTIDINGVKILGPINIPSTLAYHASALYSKNMVSFIENLFDKDQFDMKLDDDIVSQTLITHQGLIKNEQVKSWIKGVSV